MKTLKLNKTHFVSCFHIPSITYSVKANTHLIQYEYFINIPYFINSDHI